MRNLIIITTMIFLANSATAKPGENRRDANVSYHQEHGLLVQNHPSNHKIKKERRNQNDKGRNHSKQSASDHRTDHGSDHKTDHRRDYRNDRRQHLNHVSWRDSWKDSWNSIRHWSDRNTRSYRTDHAHDYRRDHYSRRWYTAHEFRSRGSHHSRQVIEINDTVDLLGLEGTKRSVYVDRAYIEFSNGRMKRIQSLEGTIRDGDLRRFRLHRTRNISRVHLHLAPSGQRGYARLAYAK
ncbi:MAG: hypothetical protein ABGY96_05565 [bacterium]|nr:hypothetical protein [Gammaproteobacteria bacterium]HIL96870.1 hypothetical protein [Pseudomonadales bacterium]